MLEYFPEDNDGGELSTDGRVIEMLSEHTVEGMLEGYVLSGRHGFFSTYEAFAHVIDSMFNQHAKWLTICNDLSWRRPIPSLNLLMSRFLVASTRTSMGSTNPKWSHGAGRFSEWARTASTNNQSFVFESKGAQRDDVIAI
jgi:phosphoketolase